MPVNGPRDGAAQSPLDATTSSDATAEAGPDCRAGTGPLVAVWSLPNVSPTTIAVDAQGNAYIGGSFNGTVTFGATTLVSASNPALDGDLFVAKYDASGAPLWAKSYGSGDATFVGTGYQIAVDSSGNVFFVGDFAPTINFGGSSAPLVAIGLDAFVVKISPNGTTLWADHFGYNGGPYAAETVAMGPDDNPVVAGTSRGTIVLGSTTWTEPTTAAQPFVAKLANSNGSVLWSNAAGGSFETDHLSVTADRAGRTFLVGRVLSGAGAWGATPADAGVNFVGFRVGFDAKGAAAWSQFDIGGFPEASVIDQAGRLSVIQDTEGSVPYAGGNTLAMLVSPTDGTILSQGVVGPGANNWTTAAAPDARGNTIVAGQFAGLMSIGPTTLSTAAYAPNSFYIAALDGASRPEGAQSIGPRTSNDSTEPFGIAVAPSGNVLVVATASTAFDTPVGSVPAGAFVAVFGPDACALDAGPLGGATGDASNHGDLPLDGSAYVPPDSAAPAECPVAQADAKSGAACPVAMGCSYGTTCCFCSPMACGAASTTWTCNDLGTPDTNCPASPPSAGAACPSTTTKCNYCLSGGRYFADCTAGGWSVGYAQIICN
jgi:hypothetical protein